MMKAVSTRAFMGSKGRYDETQLLLTVGHTHAHSVSNVCVVVKKTRE